MQLRSNPAFLSVNDIRSSMRELFESVNGPKETYHPGSPLIGSDMLRKECIMEYTKSALLVEQGLLAGEYRETLRHCAKTREAVQYIDDLILALYRAC